MEYIFFKYRLNGNDYLVFDTAYHKTQLAPRKIRRICHHHFGIGVVGIICGDPNHISSCIFYDTEGEIVENTSDIYDIFQKYSRTTNAFHEANAEFVCALETPEKVRETGKIITSEYFIHSL